MGYNPIKEVIQKDSLNKQLRTGLWNVFYKYYGFSDNTDALTINQIYENIWIVYYKLPLDDYDKDICWENNKDLILDGIWYEIYDFLEFIAEIEKLYREEFIVECNVILKNELSAYRFVDGNIIEITSDIEINEIEECINNSPLTIQTHFKNATSLLSDRNNPDYRNSIKESISAVESICKLIVKDEKTTLGWALKKLEKDNIIQLHPSLKDAFIKLYDYTNDADGIRHALKEESNLDFEDAKFMLVSCSAFVNYLITKVSKCNINIS